MQRHVGAIGASSSSSFYQKRQLERIKQLQGLQDGANQPVDQNKQKDNESSSSDYEDIEKYFQDESGDEQSPKHPRPLFKDDNDKQQQKRHRIEEEKKEDNEADVIGPTPPPNIHEQYELYNNPVLAGDNRALARVLSQADRTGDVSEIKNFEAFGYVMSGAKKRMMNLARKKAQLADTYEERMKRLKEKAVEKEQREKEIIEKFKAIAEEKAKAALDDDSKDH